MRTRSKKSTLYRVGHNLVFLIVFLLTIVIASVAVLKVNGYVINWRNLRVERLAVLALRIDPKDALIQVAGQVFTKSFFEDPIELLPGRYEVVVSKEGFHDWKHSINLEPGKAVFFEGVTLFLRQPQKLNQRPATPREQSISELNANLRIHGNELYLRGSAETKDMLITRLSSKIIRAIMLDKFHVVLQVNNEIRVMDLDGSNDILLLKLAQDQAVNLISLNGGDVLGVVSNGELTEWKIR